MREMATLFKYLRSSLFLLAMKLSYQMLSQEKPTRKKIHTIQGSTLTSALDHHAHVFQEGLGTLKDMKLNSTLMQRQCSNSAENSALGKASKGGAGIGSLGQ